MLKKILIAAATGAVMLGSIAPSYADFVRSDGTVVRTHPRRVVVVHPQHRVYYAERHHHRGYHRVWHHGRAYWERY